VQIHLKAKQYITFLFCWAYTLCSYAQIIPPEGDTIPVAPPAIESIENPETSSKKDSIKSTSAVAAQAVPFSVNMDSLKISEDALDEKIDYNSQDSMWFDVLNETVYLYGDAVVKYNTLTVTADYIVFNMKDNIVLAEGMIDSSGHLGGFPVFEEKDQKFESQKIRYNFKTNKGIIYDAVTTQQDLYVRSEKGAFFGEDPKANRKSDVIYSEDAIFTTCSHPEPHFGIRSKKQKVIPNDVVVVGPSNIEVGGIATPLWLPFAFFPLKQGPRTGLIFPRDYEYSDVWGFGLKDIGWYFPMGENMDLSLTGMIYTRGTWGLTANARYKRRYKYSGNLTLGFSDRKTEQRAQTLSNKSYSIRWSHSQDPKAHPTRRFSGSVNIQTNNFQSLNQNDAESVFENTLTSNLSYSQSFPGTPYSLTMSMNHSQNTKTRIMNITLPSINFNMNRVYPFQRKNALDNKEKWFEKISFQYKGVAQNRFTTTDTTLFSKQTLDDAQFGIKHTANSNASFRVLKFFNLTPSIDYKEIWYFDKTRKELLEVYEVDSIFLENPEGDKIFERLDTTQYGEIAEYQDFAWNPLRLFNTGVSLGTQVFGVRTFTQGKIRGIRHIIKPSVAFNYTPDYTSEGFGYFDYVDSDLRPEENDPIRYSLFENGIYDDAPTGGKQMALSYKIDNIFEAKYWSDRDSSAKKFKLFDNIATTGNYNFAADSLKWSTIRINGTTRLFKGVTTLNLSSEFDPYAINEEGRRINTYYKDTGDGFLRYIKTDIRVNTGITIKKLVELFSGKPEKTASSKGKRGDDTASTSQTSGGGDGFLDLFSSWRISHNLVMQSTADTFLIRTNSIQTGGSVQLTPKWSMRFGNISYDFKLKRLIYPTLGFYRDLHCWQMGMDWYPERKSFSFYLKVKPGSLDFIKVPYGRNNAEFGGF
jgi:lipopolysaccharide transport LptD-like protein